jgi:RNA polymerase sigma-70 factor, ECF subfamily
LLSEINDAELLERASRGDEGAFGVLYDRRQAGIYRFALQMSGSREIAEEVTQEAFITLVRDLSRYEAGRGTVSAYLYGIARKLVLRWIERERGHAGIEDEDAAEATTGDRGPLEGLLQSETIEAVRRAVLALPASYRGAVVLCDLQEMSYEEAAEAMACPVGTVRSRLNRGRALLAERLRAAKWCFA